MGCRDSKRGYVKKAASSCAFSLKMISLKMTNALSPGDRLLPGSKEKLVTVQQDTFKKYMSPEDNDLDDLVKEYL